MNDKIDILIAWVDGGDPAWQQERDRHASEWQGAEAPQGIRFRDCGNLRYWFRGVERFAPWVGNIFFVTWGHVPSWLDTSHPKLRIVRHEDFIPRQYLPTFSSNVIEFYYHRIEGLSERFVYFNDDMFLIDTVGPERFFQGGLPCDMGEMKLTHHRGKFGTAVYLAKMLINDHFDKRATIKRKPANWFNPHYPLPTLVRNLAYYFVGGHDFIGFYSHHLPQGYLQATYREVWAQCEDDLLRTSRSRFRQYGDIAPWLLRYWQLASNSFVPYNVQRDGAYFSVGDSNLDEVVDCIRHQRKALLCLNDTEDIGDFEAAKQRLIEAFDEILPERSSFELPT